nr:hypothetical protein Iba_chr07bCG12100 [Ipomoea batatas]
MFFKVASCSSAEEVAVASVEKKTLNPLTKASLAVVSQHKLVGDELRLNGAVHDEVAVPPLVQHAVVIRRLVAVAREYHAHRLLAAEVDGGLDRRQNRLGHGVEVVLHVDHQQNGGFRVWVSLPDVIFPCPVDLVIVPGAKIDHDVFVPKEEHRGRRVVQFIHRVEVRNLSDIYKVYDSKVLYCLSN